MQELQTLGNSDSGRSHFANNALALPMLLVSAEIHFQLSTDHNLLFGLLNKFLDYN